MKKILSFSLALIALSFIAYASETPFVPSEDSYKILALQNKFVQQYSVSKDGYCKGIRLAGKVKVVKSFPDLKVQVVNHFPELRVEKVTSFPDKIGQWQFVDHFPDFTIQFVDHFPDLTIQYVSSFPGVNK